MSKYAEMTDEQYFAAQDEFMKKYNAQSILCSSLISKINLTCQAKIS